MRTIIFGALFVSAAASAAAPVATIQPEDYVESLLPEVRLKCKTYGFFPQGDGTTEIVCVEKPGQKLNYQDKGAAREKLRRDIVPFAAKLKAGTATQAEKDALLIKLVQYVFRQDS